MSEKFSETPTPETNHGLFHRVAWYIDTMAGIPYEMVKHEKIKDPDGDEFYSPLGQGKVKTKIGNITILREKATYGHAETNYITVKTPELRVKAMSSNDDDTLVQQIEYEVRGRRSSNEETTDSRLRVFNYGLGGEMNDRDATGDFAGLDQRIALERTLLDVALLKGLVRTAIERAEQEPNYSKDLNI